MRHTLMLLRRDIQQLAIRPVPIEERSSSFTNLMPRNI